MASPTFSLAAATRADELSSNLSGSHKTQSLLRESSLPLNASPLLPLTAADTVNKLSSDFSGSHKSQGKCTGNLSDDRGKKIAEGSSDHHQQQQQHPMTPSRYELQKRRDWNTFGQYLKNQRPPVPLSQCSSSHVLEFLRYLDPFGKIKVHLQGCMFYGQPNPPAPCTCPLRQAWGSLDALIGRLRAAYEENGGSPETNPFASGEIRVYLREVRECQAKARGIPYKKKKRMKLSQGKTSDE